MEYNRWEEKDFAWEIKNKKVMACLIFYIDDGLR